jgi:hypothetical protein
MVLHALTHGMHLTSTFRSMYHVLAGGRVGQGSAVAGKWGKFLSCLSLSWRFADRILPARVYRMHVGWTSAMT